MTKGLDLRAEPTRMIFPWDLRQLWVNKTPHELIVYKSHSCNWPVSVTTREKNISK